MMLKLHQIISLWNAEVAQKKMKNIVIYSRKSSIKFENSHKMENLVDVRWSETITESQFSFATNFSLVTGRLFNSTCSRELTTSFLSTRIIEQFDSLMVYKKIVFFTSLFGSSGGIGRVHPNRTRLGQKGEKKQKMKD